MRRPAVISIIVALACGGTSDNRDRGVQTAHIDGATDTVLASMGTETISLNVEGGSSKLVWTSSELGSTRWTSRPLHGAVPSVEFLLADDDPVPDLFWTIMHEEFIGGELLLAVADSVRSVFVTAGDERCRLPEVGDVTGDGLVDVRTYQPYAIPEAECYGDAYAESCVTEYPTEWVRVLVQREGGFAEDANSAREYYLTVSGEYATAADRLDSAIRAGTSPPRCDAGVVVALRELAERARGG